MHETTISSFFGSCANVMTILNGLKIGNKLFTKQAYYTFKDEVRRLILPTLSFMLDQLNSAEGSLHHTRLTNFKRVFELSLGCDEHGEFFEFLKLQFSYGEFKGKTLRWLFCLFNEVMTDVINFSDYLAGELADRGISRLVKPAIAQKMKDILKCLDCVASQESNRRQIMAKYGNQAKILGGKPFAGFYDLYEEFTGDRFVFGRIVQEVELRKAKYGPLADSELLDFSKSQNEYLLSEMKERE